MEMESTNLGALFNCRESEPSLTRGLGLTVQRPRCRKHQSNSKYCANKAHAYYKTGT